MSELTSLTLKGALEGLKARKFSAVELAEAHLEAIAAARQLNAYVLETPEKALAMAEASDARLKAGEAGPLEGASLGIKDLFCTEGVQSTAGSRILEGFQPPYEFTVTANLWRDGAVMLGKLNMDEFAMGSSNETSAWGPVVNPWRSRGSNRPLSPGGSSGGSAAAVAAEPGARRHRHRHRRLDPPAGLAHRHGRDQAHLRALLALGHRGVRLLARPGRPDGQDASRTPPSCSAR